MGDLDMINRDPNDLNDHVKQVTMGDLDMINRDPNDLNDHVKVAFEDVIAEPDGAHSIDCIWTCAFCCFNCSKNCCYNLFTIFCAIPLAFCWGCQFACITFEHVWHITPCLRIFTINCGCAQKFIGTCMQCCLGPLCETCGLFFSNIMVKNN